MLPFVLLGIGVDDTFVLMQGLAMYPPTTAGGASMPVPERMANALGHAGASIMVTSLTDIIAFVLGTTSSLPGLQAFCVCAPPRQHAVPPRPTDPRRTAPHRPAPPRAAPRRPAPRRAAPRRPAPPRPAS